MELPVAKQSYLPSPEALVRAIKRARVILARMVAQETPLETATVFSNPQRPGVGLANWAADVRSPEGVAPAAAVEEIMAHFRGLGLSCFQLEPAEAICPAPLADAIEAQGYRLIRRRVYLLDRRVKAGKINPGIQIIPARAAYGPLRNFYETMARDEYGVDQAAAVGIAAARIDHLDESRLEIFLGRLEDAIVGCAGVLTLGNIGVIQAAYTDVRARGKGVAGALMEHVLDHCHRAVFEQVILDRSVDCPAVPFYESLGFKAVAEHVRYRKV